MKFVAALRMMTDELSTLASGAEVDGGQLRAELFDWLEHECAMLKSICGYAATDVADANDAAAETVGASASAAEEALRQRRRWLRANQKLLRTLTSYCILHSAQNHRLTSVLMEFILLLREVGA